VVSEDAFPTWRDDEGATKGSWEGADLGSDVSGFVVDSGPREGPDPHTHPYSETFIVLEGRGRFRYGDGFVEAGAGEIVVVPPNTAHGFTALGPGRLRMVTIHASPRMETTWLEDEDGGEVS
jgi:mannose-6-phosphate isomerase-like protein (cupin superfamily)